ncbi:MAG: type II toxin-antitoxin system RelB/DinJ family antitoxin [Rickettsiales bacterium]
MLETRNNGSVKNDSVRARISSEEKEAAEAIFNKLGIGHTEAIRIFYKQVIINQGLPFAVKIPNAETVRAMQQVKSRQGLKSYKNAKQLFDKFR